MATIKSESKSRRPKSEDGAAPQEKLTNKVYEKELARLHAELVKLQLWVVAKGLKVVVVFEGRDGAGKGGVIKAITERVNRASSASSRCPPRPSAKSRRCIFSDTCGIFRPAARS